MSILSQTWNRLDLQGETGAGFIRLRLPEVRAASTYAAKSVAEQLEAIVMEVETQALPAGAEYPEAHGFIVHAESLAPGRYGRTRLVVALTNQRYTDIFHTLAEDVVSKLVEVNTEEEAAKLFITRLFKWQSFMRKHGITGLSLEERRGLLGELLLIRNYLLDRGDAYSTICSWKGCKGANHDFQFRLSCIEVKTTSSNTPHAFHVSNIRQLDSPGQGQLFIFYIVIEESEAGVDSLPSIINSLRERLEGQALDAFEDCLLDAGYIESQSEIYDTPRYSLRREHFFRVVDSFPRLCENLLPPGVEEVSYQVAIAACAAFEVDPSDVMDKVFGTRGQGE